MTVIAKQRDSTFELMRLVSQYMIIVGHIIGVLVVPNSNNYFYEVSIFPLHVAVPIYVMLSGYFGIKASPRGFFGLLKFVLLIYVPLLIVKAIFDPTWTWGGANLASIVFPISRTNVWFIRTYLVLFLLSPIINKALSQSTLSQKILYLLLLFFISNYMGIVGNDASLCEGKNIVTFIFYYLIGNVLYSTRNVWQEWKSSRLLIVYIILNVSVLTVFTILPNTKIYRLIYIYTFVLYNSPVLWINAILSFMLLSRIKIQSAFVNRIAKSCLAIYIMHCSYPSWAMLRPISSYIMNLSESVLIVYILHMLLAAGIMVAIILIYELLTPLWNIYDKVAVRFDAYLKRIWKSRVEKVIDARFED